jgi:integrase
LAWTAAELGHLFDEARVESGELVRLLVFLANNLRGGPHTCRHTYASHFLQAVPDLHQLAGILGHSQTRVTELYTHLLPGHLDRARNAVNLSATRKALAQTLAGTP